MREIEADIVVVGAGIVGAWTALLAARRHPAARVFLVDRGLVGMGASRYGGAIRIPFGLGASHRALAQRGEAFYADARAGGLELPERLVPVHWIMSRSRVDTFTAMCVGEAPRSASAAERSDLARRWPDLVVGADEEVFVQRAAYGPPGETAEALVRHAVAQHGCRLVEGTRVVHAEVCEDGCRISVADGTMFHARTAIFATGPWPSPLPQRSCPELRIKKVVAFHIDVRTNADDPIVFFFDSDAYLLPDAQRGRALFCIASEDWDVHVEGNALHLSQRDVEIASAVLSRHAPNLLLRLSGGRAFCDGYSPDRAPIVSAVAGSESLIVAVGCSGSGYRFAPAIADGAVALAATRLKLAQPPIGATE